MFNSNKIWEDYAIENNLTLDFLADIQEGDLYLARRNTGFKLLTAKKIVDGFIIPVENEYCYDVYECVKIVNN